MQNDNDDFGSPNYNSREYGYIHIRSLSITSVEDLSYLAYIAKFEMDDNLRRFALARLQINVVNIIDMLTNKIPPEANKDECI